MFVKRLNESEETALYQAMAGGAALFDRLGFPWWLSFGTLLGSWRHHGVIPWDDDLDVAFPREQADVLKQAALAQGWGYVRLSPFLAKIWDPRAAMHRPNTPWSWPFIDVALYDEIKTHHLIVMEYDYYRQYKAIPVSELLPTQPYSFGPLTLPIPKKPELLLDILYKSWRTRPFSSHYCHRLERLYPEPQVQADIGELAQRFTFFNITPKSA